MNGGGGELGYGRIVLSVVAAVSAWTIASAPALGQWTQWGGSNRHFTTDASGLAETWPEAGPKRLWNRALGDGYATVLVDGPALYTMYRVDQDEFTVALDAKSGGTLWEHRNPSPTTPVMEQYGAGPSSTPLIVVDRLFSIGTNMVLNCFDKKTGKVLWKHDLVADFGATVPGRGYSASPIAYGRTIVLPVGGEGKEGQSVMAFDQQTGKVAWKNQSFQTTHASPILIRFAGEDQMVFFMGAELVALNPTNGELLWRHPHETQYGANLSTPVFNGRDILFCSAAYDSGARAIRLSKKDGKTATEELWYSRKMRLHHGDAVILGDKVYGSSGDFGPAFFMAVHLESGKVAWRERGFKKATFVHADDKFIILDEDGQLALARESDGGLTIHSTCKITEPYSWAAPTLAGKTLYVRDRRNIMALDLG